MGVLGVWSEGIQISRGQGKAVGPIRGVGGEGLKVRNGGESGKGKRKGKGKEVDEVAKQGRIWREWDLPGGGELRIIEQTSFDLDKVREEHLFPRLRLADEHAENLGFGSGALVLALAATQW